MSDEFSVILFFSNSHAIRAEQVLTRRGVACKLMPVPRHLSSDCGVCLRLSRKDVTLALAELEDRKVEIELYRDI